MTAFITCTRCDTTLDLGGNAMADSDLARVAQGAGWTIVDHFGAKRTRCPECRRRERFWHVPGSKVRHRQRRCVALIGRERPPRPAGALSAPGPRRRTKEPAVEISPREAHGLRDCHYCKEVS